MNTGTLQQVVVFAINSVNFAIMLDSVKRIIHSVFISPLPASPEKISGIINVSGEIVPVVDFRRILGFSPKEVSADDKMILAYTEKRLVAFLVDEVTGISEMNTDHFSDPGQLSQYAGHIKGILRNKDGLILIYDIEKFISSEDEKHIELALKSLKG